MALKIGDAVFIKNEIFTTYGCIGTITDIDGKLITVEMKRRCKKLDESEFVKRQFYSMDLRKVS